MVSTKSYNCIAVILACTMWDARGCRYGGDMSGLGAARARWNAMLLSLVAADAYVSLLEAAKVQLGPGPAYAALWPDQVSNSFRRSFGIKL
jgi:hypothetical protein